jgi:hypothetical protein
VIITDEYVAALRAFLGGEGDEEWARLAGYLIARDGADRAGSILSTLQGVALHVITRQRFARGYRDDDIAGLVATLQAEYVDADAVDPVVAGQLLYAVLGRPGLTDGVDKEELGKASLALLYMLAAEAGVAGAKLDGLLAEARPVAEQLLAQQADGPGSPALPLDRDSSAPRMVKSAGRYRSRSANRAFRSPGGTGWDWPS